MKSKNKRRRSFKEWIVDEYKETILLLRSIPATLLTVFAVSVVAMNLLANKTLVQTQYLAIDGGFLISWVSFLSMDLVAKHFGPKESNKMSIFATVINLVTCLIFFLASVIPTPHADYTAFNTIIGGTWFILLSSTVAFICSAFINNYLNYIVGKMFKKNPDSGVAFFTRSYVSTFIGQFCDNLIFSMLTFMVFMPIFREGFHWTFIQCLTCSLLGALLELIMEIIFSPIGFLICRNWQKNRVGEQYFAYINREEQK
ncbi:MAG TPA: VUT family protein [Erysipelotrichaceae bacterium]|nr:VUT family protein [Erysipelotrichaceae bacterium]